MAENFSANFSIDITQLKAGLTQANKLIRENQSAFRAAAAELENADDKSAAYQDAIDALNSTVDVQQKKIDALRSEYQRLLDEGIDPSSNEMIKLRTDINKANTEMQSSITNLNKTESAFDDYKKAVQAAADQEHELISATDQLQREIADQEKELADLNKEYSEAALTFGKSSSVAVELGKKIEGLSSSLAENKQRLKDAAYAAEDTADSNDEAASAADKLRKKLADQEDTLAELKEAHLNATLEQGEHSKAAKDLAKQIDDLSGEIAVSKRNLGELEDAAEDAADGFGVFDVALGNVVANGVSALVDGCKNAVGALLGLAEETKEYRTELAKMEAAASTAGASAEYIKDKWHDMGAVLGDEGAVAEGLNNLMAAGYTTQEEMDAITKHLEGAAIKWKDTLKFEGLADGLQETFATGAAAGAFGEMLERSGVNLDDFNAGLAECKTEAEQQNYVLDQLSKLGLAEVSDAYRAQNKDLIEANKAQSDYADAQAELGDKMQPISTALTEGYTSVLNAISDLATGDHFQMIADGISDAFSWVVDTGIPAVKTGIEWVSNNLPTVAGVIATVTAATAAFKIASIAATAAQQGMTLAQYAGAAAQRVLNAAMSANPIGLIITAIGLLVTAFITLWNNSEKFRNFWIGLWEKVKDITAKAVEGIKNIFGKIVEFVKGNWQSLLLLIANPFAGAFKLLWDNCDAFREFWINLWEKIKGVAGDAWQAISGFFSGVASWFNENVIQPIVNYFTELWNNIVSTFHMVIDPWVEIIKRAAALIYETVIVPIVQYFTDLWNSIKEIFAVVSSWFSENVIEPVIGFFKSMWERVSGFFSNLWSDIVRIFGAVSGWWKSNVSEPITKAISGAFDKVKTAAAGAWAKVKEIFGNVAGFFKEKFSAAWTAVKNIFSTGGKIFSGITEGIAAMFKKIVNKIIGGINKVVAIPFNAINKALDKLRNLAILGVSPFEWLPTIKVPQIPELAKGGIVNGATQAIIGEAGKEAVLPLERNTEWMDMLAERIAANGGGGVTVNQTNHYAQAHSRYELWNSRKQIAAAVRLAAKA